MEGQHTVFESGSPSEMPLAGTRFSLINLQSCPYCLEKWSLLANGPTSSVFDILVCYVQVCMHASDHVSMCSVKPL